jgi:hypothetical protein
MDLISHNASCIINPQTLSSKTILKIRGHNQSTWGFCSGGNLYEGVGLSDYLARCSLEHPEHLIFFSLLSILLKRILKIEQSCKSRSISF